METGLKACSFHTPFGQSRAFKRVDNSYLCRGAPGDFRFAQSARVPRKRLSSSELHSRQKYRAFARGSRSHRRSFDACPPETTASWEVDWRVCGTNSAPWRFQVSTRTGWAYSLTAVPLPAVVWSVRKGPLGGLVRLKRLELRLGCWAVGRLNSRSLPEAPRDGPDHRSRDEGVPAQRREEQKHPAEGGKLARSEALRMNWATTQEPMRERLRAAH